MPHTHEYTVSETVEASCTEGGHTVYACACGESYTEYYDPIGHSWDEGVVTPEATEEAEGEITYTCLTCGATRTEAVEKLTEEMADPDETGAGTDGSEEGKTEDPAEELSEEI